jgi:molybdenum cofactor synthesis domain-containing protein
MTIRAEIIVVSDRAARGERADLTADLLGEALARHGFTLDRVQVVPDERDAIAEAIRAAAGRVAVVLTTGGTGVTARDVTPEATRDVLEVEIPGLAEEMRRRSVGSTIHALGSRAVAGARGEAIVLNLPGSPRGAVECFEFVAPALPHLVDQRRGSVDDASHRAPNTNRR